MAEPRAGAWSGPDRGGRVEAGRDPDGIRAGSGRGAGGGRGGIREPGGAGHGTRAAGLAGRNGPGRPAFSPCPRGPGSGRDVHF
jgi:hypothetical protein